MEAKLRECISALKQCPYRSDQEIPSSFVSTIYEVNESSKNIQYYAKKWSELNIATKLYHGSKIKQKIAEIIKAIASYTRLIETVAQMAPIGTPVTVQSVRASETESNVTIEANHQSTMEKVLMHKLKEFEDKLSQYRTQVV